MQTTKTKQKLSSHHMYVIVTRLHVNKFESYVIGTRSGVDECKDAAQVTFTLQLFIWKDDLSQSQMVIIQV